MLYLAMIDITKKWTGKRKDRGQIHSPLSAHKKHLDYRIILE